MKFEICIGTFSITWLKKKGKGKRIYNVMTRNFLGVKIFALRFQRDSKRKNWKRASQVLSRPSIEIKEKYYGGEISGRRIHVANNVPLSIQLTNHVRGTFRFSMLRKLSSSLESGRFRTKEKFTIPNIAQWPMHASIITTF